MKKQNQPKWVGKLVRHEQPVPHISWRNIKAEMPKELQRKFGKWMFGQTMLLRDDGDTGIYTWDFDRWLAQGMRTEQGADWD